MNFRIRRDPADLIGAKEAKRLLDYDQTTGLMSWNVGGPGKVRGRVVGVVLDDGYVQVTVNYQRYSLHRLAWLIHYGEWPTNEIDHVNGRRADNRIENLREATKTQQEGNKLGWSRYGLPKGVAKQRKKYRANLMVCGVSKFLGSFQTPEDAHEAYCEAAKRHFGEFFCSGERR